MIYMYLFLLIGILIKLSQCFEAFILNRSLIEYLNKEKKYGLAVGTCRGINVSEIYMAQYC